MSRRWLLVVFFLVVATLSIAGYVFFVKTGGMGLSRVTWYYFVRDLPDKKYSWQDFTDRGVSQGISGFYAFGNQDGFSMWTLSGLKTFTHVPGTSVYMHEDICAAVRELMENPLAAATPVQAVKEITGDIGFWQSLIKQENLVTVTRLKGKDYHNGIDKVWSYSGIYKELNKLERNSCN